MNTLQIDPQINLKQCLLWQYNNAPALRALLLQKEAWYKTHQQEFWEYWYNKVFNLDTADDLGLQVWGEILDFPRQVRSVDGQLHVLTTEQYRAVLKGQMLKFNMGATAPEINKWLQVVFGSKGKAYCLDNLDMTAVPFVFEQSPSDEILWLLANVDFLPRPAGVGYQVRIIGQDVFGFNGSGLQTFNNGVFYKDFNAEIVLGQKQLSVLAPAGATVIINGAETNYATLDYNTPYTFEVRRAGFQSCSGNGVLTDDTVINVREFSVSAPAGATVVINGSQVNGVYFLQSLNYTCQVSRSGFIPWTAAGKVESTTQRIIRSLQIAPHPADSTVILNGQELKNAFFENRLDYSYEVSHDGYGTKTGSGTAYGDLTLDVELAPLFWQQARYDIGQSIGSGLIEVGRYLAPSSGRYTIALAGGGRGHDSERYKTSRGGISTIQAQLSRGDELVFTAIAKGYGLGCVGMSLSVNNTLVAVSGGGGYVDDDNTCYGGDGYVGGYCNSGPSGTGINGGTSQSTMSGADGSYNYWQENYPESVWVPIKTRQAYGGQGYAITEARFQITQVAGVQDGAGNDKGAYFTITFLGE